MRRVVVTGMGIVSSIGNSTQEVLASLREAKSGIVQAEDYARLGFRCQVHGKPSLDPEGAVDRRAMRFHGGGTAWNHVAMDQAIRDAGLEDREVSHERTGIIMGSGGPSTRSIVEAADVARQKGPKRVGPFAVPKAMSSTASATLATWFKIKGVNYPSPPPARPRTIASATRPRSFRAGGQDIIFAGGSEELDWTLSVLFDAWGRCRPSTTRPGHGLARLRREPRRLRHRGRGRRRGARRNWRMPRREGRASMARSSATGRPRTATTWWRPRARARCAA
jgi:3-oxoacyl-[acyl-carrier-protein] synthase-1